MFSRTWQQPDLMGFYENAMLHRPGRKLSALISDPRRIANILGLLVLANLSCGAYQTARVSPFLNVLDMGDVADGCDIRGHRFHHQQYQLQYHVFTWQLQVCIVADASADGTWP